MRILSGRETVFMKDAIGPELVIEVHRQDVGLEGYLVIDNTTYGPGKGGIRMHGDVSRREITDLARGMSLKTALVELPLGGAKAGIVWHGGNDKHTLFQAFIEEIQYMMPYKYIGAPDMGTSAREMGWLVDITGDHATTTGKPVERGGMEHKPASTGYGVAVAAATAAEAIDLDIEGARVAVDGYGAVGSWAAAYLQEYGARLVATSGRNGAVHNPEGLDTGELDRLRETSTPVTDYADARRLSHEDMLHLDCDIIVTASISNVITEHNYARITAPLIVEGSNLPMTHTVEEKLHERNITVIPDIVANTGGVIASYVEHAVDDKSQTTTEYTISQKITRAVGHILRTSRSGSRYPREAALNVAEARLREQSALLGHE